MRSGERVVGAELVIERPDGSRVPVLMNVEPLKDPSGGVAGAVCSFQELTERKRAEEALRASEAELQSVINRTPFMLVRCSRDMRYRFISEAYAQYIGHGRDEVIGKTIEEMIGEKCLQHASPLYRSSAAGRARRIRMRTRFSARSESAISPLPTVRNWRLPAMSAAGSLRCSTSPNKEAANRRAGSSPTSSNRPTMRLSARISKASSSAGIRAPSVCLDIRLKRSSASRSRCLFPLSYKPKNRKFSNAFVAASALSIMKPFVAARMAG